MPSVRRPEPVTVARMPEPTVRYWSRQLPHDDTSPESWGPRIADEDLDLVIRRLSPVRGQRPTRGLRIEEPMADRRGTKRPTEEDRRERLAKMANLGKGKGKAGTSAPPSQNVAPPATRATPAPSAPATATAATPTPAPQTSRPPGFSRDDRQPARPDVRSSRTREDRPATQSLAPRSARGESRLDPAPLPLSQTSSTYRALVTMFEERFSVEITESSKRSDPVQAANDGVNKQIEALCIMLSGYAAAKGFANQMADEVNAANTDARHARRAEKEARTAKEAAEEARKEAEDRAKVAEERAKEAEGRQRFAEDLVQKADQVVEEAETSKAELEEALHKTEQELASVRVEHERYIRVALPAALKEAWAQAVADFLGSEDFNERVVQMYREESEETVAKKPPEEGEVIGTAREFGDVIILDDQVAEPEQPTPVESVQAAATAEPEPEPAQSATVVSADQEQSEPPAA
ncbi:hypothetical protein TIFTF001_034884 [Ficus carica]|uniref:Uncharacterized protein n=1 Tax=Ficus carica TaxID=3494 RepID=A0AA88E0Q9_FICCA|nr:hypothetical protein TIFTF001_034884 [Ficus carica]